MRTNSDEDVLYNVLFKRGIRAIGRDEFAGHVGNVARRYEARVSVYHEYISSGQQEELMTRRGGIRSKVLTRTTRTTHMRHICSDGAGL